MLITRYFEIHPSAEIVASIKIVLKQIGIRSCVKLDLRDGECCLPSVAGCLHIDPSYH